MKRVVLNKPNDTVDFENFNPNSMHVICAVEFRNGLNYYYSPTKLEKDRHCLINISYPGGYNIHNDSNDIKIWANPKTMLREFLEECPDQKSMYQFNSQQEMFAWLARQK